MIVDIRSNGFGVKYGQRFPEEVCDPALWFDSAPGYMDRLLNKGVMVLGGEPGAGKSHIASDIFNLGVANDLGCVMLSCHINAGSRKGRATTEEVLSTARDAGKEAVVIFDNFDFAVYTGASKKRITHRQVDDFCRFITEQALSCVDSGCSVMATVHTEEWRRNHSKADSSVHGRFSSTIESMGGIEDFEGNLSAENTLRILLERKVEVPIAEIITQGLKDSGSLCFRQAYHINPEVASVFGVEAAKRLVDIRKQQKLDGGA